jgi:hypothetical protein
MANSDLKDLETETGRLYEDIKYLYRLDEDNRSQLWEAYCGGFDPNIVEDREFATNIGQQLQNKEREILEATQGLVSHLIEAADLLKKDPDTDPDTKEEVKEILTGLRKVDRDLQKLYDGVVLTGSNHPLIQTTLEYGKRMHDEYGKNVGEDPRVYDKPFPGVDGRPDLVTIESGKLVIYEFKPNNSKAVSKGWEQVRGYAPGVTDYYESFFVDGRNAGYKSSLDDNHGGQPFQDKLMNSPDAWSSDGKRLEPVLLVLTYQMCDKNVFDL